MRAIYNRKIESRNRESSIIGSRVNHKDYMYFSLGGKELTVFESQVLPWLEEARKHFKQVGLVIISGFRSRKQKGIEEFCKKHNILYYHFLYPLWGMPILWMDILRLYLKLYKFRWRFSNVVIHCRSEIAGYIVLKLTSFFYSKNYKVICDIRGDSVDEIKNSHENKIIKFTKSLVFLRALKYCCAYCDIITCVTSNLVKVVEKRTKTSIRNKLIVIPAVVQSSFRYDDHMREEKRNELNIPLEATVWIYIGGLDYWQNPYALKNFVMNKIACNNFFIFLTQHMQIANFFLERLSLNQLIIKQVRHREIPAYLNASDIGVIMRKDTSTNYCASPVKLAEYLCNGLKISSIGEIGLFKDLPLIKGDNSRLEKSEKYLSFFNIEYYFSKIMLKTGV